MTKLFERDRTVITKHINNIFKEGELAEKSNVQNMHLANSDKPVKSYNLDVVISVGYRVKSLEGTRLTTLPCATSPPIGLANVIETSEKHNRKQLACFTILITNVGEL